MFESFRKVIAGLIQDLNFRNYVDISNLSKELYYIKAPPGIYTCTNIAYLLPFYRNGKFRLLLTTKKIFWMHLRLWAT